MLRAIGASLGKLDGRKRLGQYRDIPGRSHMSLSLLTLDPFVVKCAPDFRCVHQQTTMFGSCDQIVLEQTNTIVT